MTIFAGVELARLTWERLLGASASSQDVHLLLDMPRMYALLRLPTLEGNVLVVTDNRSPAYLRDLLRLKPAGIIATPVTPLEIKAALETVAQGKSLYLLPHLPDAQLTLGERNLLQLFTLGADNAHIAKLLNISKKTVANRLSELYDKIGAKSRVQAALYYMDRMELSSLLENQEQRQL
jgi:DNA-binding NarL/FixJ family response regulator